MANSEVITLPFGITMRISVTSSGHRLTERDATVKFDKMVEKIIRDTEGLQTIFLLELDEEIRAKILSNFESGKGRAWSRGYVAWRQLQAEMGNEYGEGNQLGVFTGQFRDELEAFFGKPGEITQRSRYKETLKYSMPRYSHLAMIWSQRQFGFPTGKSTGQVTNQKVIIPILGRVRRKKKQLIGVYSVPFIVSSGTGMRTHRIPPRPLISESELQQIMVRVSANFQRRSR